MKDSPTDSTSLGPGSPEPAEISAHIKGYARANDRQAVWALVQTVVGELVALAFYAMDQVALGVILEAGVLLRAFILFHDAIHSSFFSRGKANQWLARILQAWVITPVELWKRNHLHHHRWFGNLQIKDHADTIFFTRQQYQAFPPYKRRLIRLLRTPILFFLLVPLLQWWIQYPFLYGNRFLWLGHAFHLFIAWQVSGWHLLSLYLGGLAGLMLFHLQHGVNRGYRQTSDDWSSGEASLLGATCLRIPAPLTWFTFGIEFHHIHHANMAVPGYRLARCHRAAPKDMWRDVTTPSLMHCIRSIRNVMWDDETRKLVPF